MGPTQKQRHTPENRGAGPQLLIVDELGHLPMPGEAASHLFQVISHATGSAAGRRCEAAYQDG